MVIYTANLCVVALSSFLAEHFQYRSPIRADGTQRPLLWFVLLTVLSLTLVNGLRFLCGTDYVNYAIMYHDVRSGGMAALEARRIEWGYLVLSALFGKLFEEPFVFFFCMALVTNLLVILALRKYSEHFWISCVLYILTFIFYGSFNLIRQTIAMSIVIYAHQSLIDKRMFRYFLIILIAALFHTSVLVMIPVYFIVQRPAWSPIIWCGFVAVLLFFVFYDSAVSILFSFLSHTRYSTYEQMIKDSDHGANILRIVVAGAPVLLAFLFRTEIKRNYPHSNLVCNMAVLSLLIAIMGMKQIYFTRISLYFSVYNMLLIPYIIDLFQDKRMRLEVGAVILGCYLAYCYLLLPNEGGVLPYYSIFSAPYRWNIMNYIPTR